MHFAGLAYRCKACQENNYVMPAKPDETKTQTIQDISAVKQSIIALDTKLQVLQLELGPKMSTILPGIYQTNGCPHEINGAISASTYAHIVNKDVANISEVVTKKMKTSIATQKKDDRISAAVAVYYLNEKSHDYCDISDVLNVASSQCCKNWLKI